MSDSVVTREDIFVCLTKSDVIAQEERGRRCPRPSPPSLCAQSASECVKLLEEGPWAHALRLLPGVRLACARSPESLWRGLRTFLSPPKIYLVFL